MIMIRVKYNLGTGQILGNYPANMNYPSITIDEVSKTITDQSGTFPYIEVTTLKHKQGINKNMVVIDGNYQEYVKTDAELLQEAKNNKIAEIQVAKEIDLYLNVSYNNKDFISSEKAVSNMTGAIILNQDSYNWLDVNSNPNIMTVNDLKNLVGIIATQRSLIYNKEALKIKAVNDSQTIEEVNNINWKDNLSLGRKTKKTIKSI
jgi:hypothetical protein